MTVCAGIDARTALEDKRRGWARYAEELLLALGNEPGLNLRVLFPNTATGHAVAARLEGRPNLEVFVTDYAPRTPYPHADEGELAPERWLGKVDLIHSLTRFVLPTEVRPVVVTVHDVIPLAKPPFKLFLREDTLHAIEVMRRPGYHVIANSELTKRELCAADVDPRSVTVVLLGAAEAFLRAPSGSVGPRSGDVLYVGGAEPNKNLPVLVRAVAEARRHRPFRLLLAGAHTWGYDEALGDFVAENWIDRLGYVEDDALAELQRRVGMLVFPSLHEGFGLPVLEAMACGTPVICSDIPVLHEVAGDAALYFAPDSIAELRHAIERLHEDHALGTVLGSRGRERALTMTWPLAAKRTHELYRAVVGR